MHGTQLALEIVSVCEAGCFSVSRLFALALIHEPLLLGAYRSPGVVWRPPPAGPLASRFTADEIAAWAASGVPGTEEARLSLIHDVGYAAFRNLPRPGAGADDDGLYRVGLPAGHPRAKEAARAFADATRPLYESAHRLPLGRMPGALLRIAVDDPRWLSHLSPGMIWDSYVFDEEATALF